MKHASRRAMSAALPTLLAVGLIALPAAGAQAADQAPSEVTVVPADNEPTSAYTPTDTVSYAGATGFLHSHSTYGPLVWTSYDGGSTHVVPGLSKYNFAPAGGDEVSLVGDDNGYPSTVVPVINLATGAVRQLNRGGYIGSAYVAGNHLLIWPTNASDLPELRTYAADGTYTVTPITTWSTAKATHIGMQKVSAAGAVVYVDFQSAAGGFGLLDFATGRIMPVPMATGTNDVTLTNDRIVTYSEVSGVITAAIYSRADVVAGTATQPLASYRVTANTTLVGDDILETSAATTPILHTPDAPAGIALPWKNSGSAVQAPDDTATISSGTGPADWAFQRISASGSTVLLPLHGQKMVVGGLTLSNGVLRRMEVVSQPGETATRYWSATSAAVAGATPTFKGIYSPPITCGPTCLHTVADESESLFLESYGANMLGVYDSSAHPHGSLPSTSGTIVDAGYGYIVVNGTDPTTQYISGIGYQPAITRTQGAAAIAFNTLWTAPKAGTLQQQPLLGGGNVGVAGATISTGASCTATELQATNRYVYWSCGASGPAGVYDLTAKTDFTVPAASYELGDGYLVHHAADGNLIRNTITGGVFGADVVLANFAVGSGDERNISWTVDKFGGDVAWVDADNATHVVDPAVPPSPVTLGGLDKPDGDMLALPATWTATAYPTRPVDSWSATFTQVSSGKAVHTESGGAVAGTIPLAWDGLVDGAKATSGHYNYTLSVTIGGVTTAITTGTLLVTGGPQPFHSFQNAGAPSIFAITTNAQGHWLQTNTANLSLADFGSTGTYPLGSTAGHYNAIVPFGDANGDGLNDLITRSATGTLLMVASTNGQMPNFTGAPSINLGSNWNIYNALVSVGDLNGDGKADLVAREADNGTIWIYPSLGNGHFGSRYAIAGSYKGYNRIIGVGDITGDGKPDLLLTGPTGIMYEMRGNGTGGFGPVVAMGSGYTPWNAIIGIGDLNEDGRDDLLVRDTSGNLYRMLGTGNGYFTAPQKIGTGYQQYAGLY